MKIQMIFLNRLAICVLFYLLLSSCNKKGNSDLAVHTILNRMYVELTLDNHGEEVFLFKDFKSYSPIKELNDDVEKKVIASHEKGQIILHKKVKKLKDGFFRKEDVHPLISWNEGNIKYVLFNDGNIKKINTAIP